MRVAVIDSRAERLSLALVEPGAPDGVLARSERDPGDLTGLFAADLYVHRFVVAPDGAPEVCADLDPAAVTAAGWAEPADTAARCATYAQARAARPEQPHLVVFDTVFFDPLPAAARTYALPAELAERHGLRRRGRHGPLHRLAAATARRVVSVYLGPEASVAALVGGSPVEVSAGLTAAAGIPGGTTCGDLDPAVVLYLADALGRSLDEIERALVREGGLTGYSRGRATPAELLADDDADARLALAALSHRVRRYVGAYAAVMGGLDALVFSAEPGYLLPPLRDAIVAGLGYLGVGAHVPVIESGWCLAGALARVAAEAIESWTNGG